MDKSSQFASICLNRTQQNMVWLVRFSDRLRRHLQRLEEWESSKGRANWKSSVHEIRKAKKTWRSKVYHGIMFISCWGNRWLLSGSTSLDCTCIAFDHGPVPLEKLSAKEALKTDRHSLIALLAFHQSTSCESLWPDMNGYGTTYFFSLHLWTHFPENHCSIKVWLLVRHCHEHMIDLSSEAQAGIAITDWRSQAKWCTHSP